jgi:hypothetical protein
LSGGRDYRFDQFNRLLTEVQLSKPAFRDGFRAFPQFALVRDLISQL